MKRLLIAAAGLVLLVAGGGVAFALLSGGDAPPPPRLERGRLVVRQDLGNELWRVSKGSFAGYRVDEEYLGVGVNTAVGRTSAVTGTLRFDSRARTLRAADLEADLTQLRSDEARRDRALTERGIETSRYPKARFTLTGPVSLDPGKQRVRGTLELHGRTSGIVVTVEVATRRFDIELVGSAPIRFADFGIEPPSVAGLVTVKDEGELEFKLIAAPD